MDDYGTLLANAIGLQLWSIARSIARSILEQDPREGNAILKSLYRQAGGRWNYHSIKHDTLAQLQRVPGILISPAALVNVVLSNTAVIFREIGFRFRLIRWLIAYKTRKVIVL
jgi:hypothetical protein